VLPKPSAPSVTQPATVAVRAAELVSTSHQHRRKLHSRMLACVTIWFEAAYASPGQGCLVSTCNAHLGCATPCRHRAMLAVGSMRWRPQEATGSARQVPVQAGVTTAPAQTERVREVISQPQSPAIPLQVGFRYNAHVWLACCLSLGPRFVQCATISLLMNSRAPHLQFLDGEVVAGGALKVLQDVGSDVFVSMHGAESLVLGVATTDGAASMVDTAIGLVCSVSKLHDRPTLAFPQFAFLMPTRAHYTHSCRSLRVRSCLVQAHKCRDCVISHAAALQSLSGGGPLQAVVDDAGVGQRRAGPDPGDAVLAAGAPGGRAIRDHAAAHRPGHLPWHLATTGVRLQPP